ncbi:MAG: metal-dependent hydrolase, partial [Acidobacteria bacterium Pan2503]|nr:metal-dependent hydrolase [Candidatus Acidoferrum panamensis]
PAASLGEQSASEGRQRPKVTRGRIVTWSLMLGAIFPDSDVLRDLFSHDRLLVVTWHRSITHSLVMLPLWAMLLAGLTRALTSWRKWEAPSFAASSGIYAVGILSHILLDLVTSFGTMIWSPLKWSRPAWDLLFIVDFNFTGIVLVPQLLAWVYSHPGKTWPRALGTWLVFMPVPVLVARLAEAVDAPISGQTVLGAMMAVTAVFLLPAVRGWGLRVRHSRWNGAGFAAGLAYVALTFFAHRVALARIHKFAELDHLQVESIGALPLPPSLWHWDGLVRSERGVYELRMDLGVPSASDTDLLASEHRYYPDAPPNSYIEEAKRLPEVQKVLWFARFPVTRFHKEGSEAIVDILDVRFSRTTADRPPAFTYRVRFGADGSLLSQGWATR